MLDNRRLRRSKRKEREQKVIGMKMSEQLMGILQMKYLLYGSQILLKVSVVPTYGSAYYNITASRSEYINISNILEINTNNLVHSN